MTDYRNKFLTTAINAPAADRSSGSLTLSRHFLVIGWNDEKIVADTGFFDILQSCCHLAHHFRLIDYFNWITPLYGKPWIRIPIFSIRNLL